MASEKQKNPRFRMREALTVKFVKLYREQENLWNLYSPDYRNREVRRSSLQAIVDGMNIENLDVRDVAIKVKSLRSTYHLELAKIAKSKASGVSANLVYKPTVSWFEDMDFIMKIANTKGRETSSNLEFETQMNLQSESSDSLNSRITSNEIEHVDDVLSVQMDPEDQSEFETQQTVLSETPDTMNSMNTSNEIECVDDVLSVQMFPEDQPVSKSTKRPPQEPATSTSYNPKRRSSTVTAAVPEPKSTVAPPTSPTPMAHLEDECDVMGKQIAVQLRELPVEDRLRANLEIQRILMEFRLKHISKR